MGIGHKTLPAVPAGMAAVKAATIAKFGAPKAPAPPPLELGGRAAAATAAADRTRAKMTTPQSRRYGG